MVKNTPTTSSITMTWQSFFPKALSALPAILKERREAESKKSTNHDVSNLESGMYNTTPSRLPTVPGAMGEYPRSPPDARKM